MVFKCCVTGCNSNYRNGPRVTVFRFPRDENLKEKWLKNIPRENYNVTDSSRLGMAMLKPVTCIGLSSVTEVISGGFAMLQEKAVFQEMVLNSFVRGSDSFSCGLNEIHAADLSEKSSLLTMRQRRTVGILSVDAEDEEDDTSSSSSDEE